MNSSYTTPFYKILLTIGCSSILFFLPFYLIVSGENKHLDQVYQSLREPGPTVFGTLTESVRVEKSGKRAYLVSYRVPDELGKLYEITEQVDENLHQRLRVGDSIEVRRLTFETFGKTRVLARIKKNSLFINDFDFLETFAMAGLCFSGLLLFSGIYYWIFKDQAA
ncbi:hypothetical protein [Leptospira kmetyi]|uniref:DUF3592 domain-containing protein n=1 Tax=Leptospira kmetyi TaxID=408139 RepID=A0A2M9XQK4_9LEPT|nr:hypothetical protein [Leptospira kmetyi]AYV57807.1 hypothetical protein EFP84_19460 [Leptospira kmetyi]EQA55808.1 hypothetical protein LEP1GSC052_0436 [Leptospira kmetyi serovar Malaysia str. Bejo-Iso9]PJZ30347.1 hypothetical protein CH378_07915 [Leptospira kmetyi]PJZ41587.1 hypothetical protein CH370_09040 [Leptospira kmetyi]TGK15065.1 hypothetical protein EHO62_16765 [Leptospira kmetyi]